MEEGTIKTIVPTDCPHCKGTFFVQFSMTPVSMTGVFTSVDVKNAKDDAVKKVMSLDISEEKKKSIIDWITDGNTLFGPAEIPMIIDSLLTEQ